MKKILLILSLITLLPVITRAQSQIDQFHILQLGFNTSPGNPPSFTGYLYINNSGQLVCTLHNGSSCLSGGGGGTGTIIASPSPDCLPYYQGANTTLTADCALVTDTVGGLTLVKLTVSGATTGVITLKTGSAPSNPSSGFCSFYVNSGTNVLTGLNSSGGTCMPAAASPGGASTNVQFNNGVGGFGGDSTFLWDSSVHAGLSGSDGVSVPGTMTYLLPSESYSITNNFAVLGTFTGSGSAFIGQAPFAVQANINPSVADHTTFFAGANILTQTPSTETADIGSMEGTFSEVRYNGTGTIGANNGDLGLFGIDGEAFMESSAVLSNHGGARGVYGVFGYLGSGTSPVGAGSGGEFQFEIGNGSSGSLGHGYGVAIDNPLNYGGTGITTVALYDALSVGCTVQGFITTQNCINVTGSAPNILGTGLTSIDTLALAHAGGGSASAPLLYAGTDIHTGWYHPGNNTWSWSGNSTLTLEINYANGLFLHDGANINFSSTTGSLDKDTSLSRKAAGVVAVGAGASDNDSTGKIKASGFISEGTKFTTNNGCTDSATAGGGTAGTFTVGSTSCTEIVTMGDSATAPNGWSCTVVDITTLGDVTNPHQTTSSTTTATFVTGTVVSGDKIQFSCIGY